MVSKEENKKSEAAQRPVDAKSAMAGREERVLEFWKEKKIFERSLQQSEGKREFIFYEGPPTANGKPGIHHLEARAFKDAIPRYKTMRGFHVRRKGGWDTHGLPVELQVEKKLGLNSKKAIEEYGVAKFNQECKESVWEYLDIWNKFTTRVGFWVDQENPYVTYHNDYIESLWNIVKKINEQNLLYKDYKVVPWCPRCGTALSSHELAQGYEDVKDLSVTVKFLVKDGSASGGKVSNTYILAWTTTPWTLPGNVALAVGENIDYVKIKVGEEYYFLAKERLSIITEPYEIMEEVKGAGLVGLEYEPLFPFLAENLGKEQTEKLQKAYRVHRANFVTTEDGTGVVHTAVMYGQDDFVLGAEVGLPKHHLVGLDGKFLTGTGFLEGRFVKDEEVAVDIIKDLAHRGLLYKKEKYEHSYPHCWRCQTPLIYYARDSWYIEMSNPRIKAALIAENKDINWEPTHIRDGRFGEWLREIKDWAISRERYWGTPLPVWVCDNCKQIEVIGSISDLQIKTKKSGNRYFIMRHGEAKNNTENHFNASSFHNAALSELGKNQTQKVAENFKQKIDIVIASPFPRVKETAKIFCKQIGFSEDKIIYDPRVQEWEVGSEFEGKSTQEVDEYYLYDYIHLPFREFRNGESFAQLVKRVGNFIYEIESKYSNQNILVVGHDGATRALEFVVNGNTFSELGKNVPMPEFENAKIKEFNFIPLPHNENYELDLHRPYIDEMELACSCGGKMSRVKEVMDVWFDSGAMPFAQDHYPFENKNWVDGPGYPADFIAEAIDQTRGWFYTLHAIGALLGRGKAFKNVICLGHLMDAAGKKMSKSLGNVVDPFVMMEKYGADVLRLWMYSVNQPGESKNFDEKTVALLQQQIFGLLYNVLAFYELYRDKNLENNNRPKSKNILDKWILIRLDELIKTMTEDLDNYRLLEPVRGLRDFIGDLSTWYLRRSRERVKEGEKEAKQTLYFVFKTLSKLLAPFAPFAAEDIWQKLKTKNDKESVHLVGWPKKEFFSFGQSKILENTKRTREIVTLGLEARQKAGLKVRQPLNQLKVKNYNLADEYTELIKDELNVKQVILDNKLNEEVLLDTAITEELKQEGDFRELVRGLQDIRKQAGLTPADLIALTLATNEEGEMLVRKFEPELKKTVLVSQIKFAKNNGSEIKVDELVFQAKVAKI